MKEETLRYLGATLISAAAVFAPIKGILLVTGFLIGADLLTGILAARKRKESINSAGLRRTVSKCLVYNLAVVSGFLVEAYMISEILPISKLIAGVISLVELKSILENLNVLNGSDIFKTVIVSLGSKNDEGKQEEKKEP